MPEDDPLKSLLDGDISSEELEAIRSSPDLRKLAIRMYGESILNLLGEEETEMVESIEVSQDDELEMVDIIPEPIQVVRSTIEVPGRNKGQVENKSSISPIVRIGLGLSFVGVGLTNVYWGLGNILSPCASEVHSTCGVSLKLNLLEFHRLQEHIAWGPTGQWGIPDLALVGIGVVSLILGIIRRR